MSSALVSEFYSRGSMNLQLCSRFELITINRYQRIYTLVTKKHGAKADYTYVATYVALPWTIEVHSASIIYGFTSYVCMYVCMYVYVGTTYVCTYST